jgi:hypothetical protein
VTAFLVLLHLLWTALGVTESAWSQPGSQPLDIADRTVPYDDRGGGWDPNGMQGDRGGGWDPNG